MLLGLYSLGIVDTQKVTKVAIERIHHPKVVGIVEEYGYLLVKSRSATDATHITNRT